MIIIILVLSLTLLFSGASLSPKSAAAILKCLNARERKGKELDRDPKGPSFCAGILYSGSGMHQEAISMFSDALERCVDIYHEDACRRLSSSLEKLAQMSSDREILTRCEARAIDAYSRAIDMHPSQSSAAVIRLAELLISRGSAQRALSLCKKRTSLDYVGNEEKSALKLVSASALTRLGRHKEALRFLRELLDIERSSFNFNNAALAAEKANENELAERLFIEAMEFNSTHANTLTNYGVWLRGAGREEEARLMLQRAIVQDPKEKESETSHAKVQLASLTTGGVSSVDNMARDYVVGLFDGFAASFERVLVDDLKYVAPEIAAKLLLDILPVDTEGVVLDLGSGTGLFGVKLRSAAATNSGKVKLVGVDLSKRMLGECESDHPEVYNELHHADAVQYLRTLEREAGLLAVMALDVFIYIGDMEELFQEVSQKLQVRGAFIFTIEVLGEGQTSEQQEGVGKGWRLMEQGRFSHTLEYIEALAARYSFDVARVDATPIRYQHDRPVPSRTYALRKK